MANTTGARFFATRSNPSHFHILYNGRAACRSNIIPPADARERREIYDSEQIRDISSRVAVTFCRHCR